jgi:DNA-binding beta-propeller fold protein YncE
VPLAFTPTVIGASPTGAILVGNPVSGTIEYFSTVASAPVSISIGGRPGGVSFSPDGSLAYATVSSDGMVVSIDIAGTMATISSISLGGVPEGIATSLTTGTIVFVASTSGLFSAVNFVTGEAYAKLIITGIPRQIVLSGERAYVSNSIRNSINVIDIENHKNCKKESKEISF